MSVAVKVIIVLVLATLATLKAENSQLAQKKVNPPSTVLRSSTPKLPAAAPVLTRPNPLKDKKFYINPSSNAARASHDYSANGDTEKARLIQLIADQPSAIWLNGPTESDPQALNDSALVQRTSEQAYANGTVPFYQLYAIPHRDACAAYSSGGFTSSSDYLKWLDRIVAALKTPAVFGVEPDAVAQMVDSSCLNPQEKEARYTLLKDTIVKLKGSSSVIAVYLDAGHAEWFSDPAKLAEPLQKAGVLQADGITVNVSNFVDTTITTNWVEKLLNMLGGNKGAIIDTSRNSRGAPASSVTGEARWCNPKGMGLGRAPTTSTQHESIDAYMWIKNPGDSDGACFGYPAAGQFVPDLALELARNAEL